MFLLDWFYGVLAFLGLWQKEANILFRGVDNASRTTLISMLKNERLVPIAEEFRFGRIKFKAFDLGGPWIARRVWRDYGVRVDAVVYLANVEEWLLESEMELEALFLDKAPANVPFLVLVGTSPEGASEEPFLVDFLVDCLRSRTVYRSGF